MSVIAQDWRFIVFSHAAEAIAATPSSAQGWFILGAALVAAIAAVAGATIAAVSAAKTRRWVGRDRWWTRFSWAIEKAVSDEDAESELGLSVLIALVDVPWAGDENNTMALAVTDIVSARNSSVTRTGYKRWRKK